MAKQAAAPMMSVDEDDNLALDDAPEQDEDLSGLDRGDNVEVEDEEELDEAPAEDPEEEPEAGEPEQESEEEPEAEESEAEEPEEPEAEEPEPEPAAQAEKQHSIPKYRFDEVNERRKAAERRARELERQQELNDPSKAIDFDFDAKERRYAELVMDGDHDKALELRREIRQAEQTAYRVMAERQAEQTRESTKEELAFDTAVEELNAAYPAFDPNAEGYNKELVDEALDLHAGFLARGYTPAGALRKSVLYVAAMNGLRPAGEEPVTPSLNEAPKAPAKKKTDVKAKLEAAGKQPPRQKGVGVAGEKKVDLDSMSEEEFDALPEATKARLRGDA